MSFPAIRNRILAALPQSEYARLEPGLRPVALEQGSVLYCRKVECAYFLTDGLVCLVACTESGNSIQVGMIGREGILGIPIVLGAEQVPYSAVVVVSGEGVRAGAELLQAEFRRKGRLHDLFLKFWCLQHVQISQSALCNRFHAVEPRLCRWLLMARERLGSDEIHITQEFLGQMLGASRAVVTLAAGELQRAGLIRYHRGRIIVLEPEGLESTSCECYRIIKQEYDRTLSKIGTQDELALRN